MSKCDKEIYPSPAVCHDDVEICSVEEIPLAPETTYSGVVIKSSGSRASAFNSGNEIISIPQLKNVNNSIDIQTNETPDFTNTLFSFREKYKKTIYFWTSQHKFV